MSEGLPKNEGVPATPFEDDVAPPVNRAEELDRLKALLAEFPLEEQGLANEGEGV